MMTPPVQLYSVQNQNKEISCENASIWVKYITLAVSSLLVCICTNLDNWGILLAPLYPLSRLLFFMTPSLEPKIGVENNLGVWVNNLKQDKETAGQKSKMNTPSSHPKISSSHLGDRILFKPRGEWFPAQPPPGEALNEPSRRECCSLFSVGRREYWSIHWSIGVLEYWRREMGVFIFFFWEFIRRFTQTFSFLMNDMIECYNFFECMFLKAISLPHFWYMKC